MDPKDPVWDDDDSSPESDGFHPQSTPPAETAPGASEEPEALEVAPAEPIPVPPPAGERMRVEPVDSLRRPSAGGGRSAAGSRERRDRGSTSMVVIALMLFLISVISIGVYFFSRQARDESGGGGTDNVEFIDQNDQASASSKDVASQEASVSQEPTDNGAVTTPPPPPPGAPAAPVPVSPKNSQVPAATTSSTRDGASSPVTRNERQSEPAPEPVAKPVPKAPVEPAKPAPLKDMAKPQQPLQNAAPTQRTNPQLKTTKGNNAGDAQWVIQVHSSASVDDADEWLQQLQSRNVGDGRIEPVTQQGKVWYRVRFGRYATREEAEQAALQLGFRNAWIDRVR